MREDAGCGVGEDPDFDERFRRQRLRRWARGVRNGMSLASLIGYRLGISDEIRFRGITVRCSENQATYRLIEDIWMRGEYDLPGWIPQPGWRVIDIGANVGIYGMLAASRGARVVGYEPAPCAFERLRANTARWGVQCHQAAVVGAPRERVALFIHPLRDTRNTLLGPTGGVSNTQGVAARTSFRDAVEVPAVTIASVLSAPCDLLKVACEAGEFEIFAHAGEELRNARRIILELHTDVQTEYGDADDLVHTVEQFGFAVGVRAPYPGTSRRFLTAVRI
jgi:FkbM family methyltransferase